MERRNKITALLLQQRIVAAATIVATLLLCSVPSMAQSEIDPMGDGGSLGGDSGQTENGVAQVVVSLLSKILLPTAVPNTILSAVSVS